MKKIKDYFYSESDFLSYMLVYGDGEEKAKALRVRELIYGDELAARNWVEWILRNTDGEENTLSEVKKIYKSSTGKELSDEEIENVYYDFLDDLEWSWGVPDDLCDPDPDGEELTLKEEEEEEEAEEEEEEEEAVRKTLFGSNWLPSLFTRPTAPYFTDRAQELCFYLLELSGTLRETKLSLREVENNNFETAYIWYKAVEDGLRSGSLSEDDINMCLATARSVLDDSTGVFITDEQLATDYYEVAPLLPKAFKSGEEISDSESFEMVTKVTKCYVWFTRDRNMNQLEKRKIKRNNNGSEYCESVDSFGNNRRWEPV